MAIDNPTSAFAFRDLMADRYRLTTERIEFVRSGRKPRRDRRELLKSLRRESPAGSWLCWLTPAKQKSLCPPSWPHHCIVRIHPSAAYAPPKDGNSTLVLSLQPKKWVDS